MFTVPLNRAAKLIDAPLSTVCLWVANEDIVPYRRGGRGRGRATLFTSSQLINLAVAAAFSDIGGNGGTLLRRRKRAKKLLTDADVKAWLRDCPYLEERIALEEQRNPAGLLDISAELNAALLPRLQRIGRYLRRCYSEGVTSTLPERNSNAVCETRK